MKKLIGFYFVFSCLVGLTAPDLSRMQTAETHRFLLGLGIQFLVPDELPGFVNSQMVFCPRVYLPFGTGHFQLGASYGNDSGVYPQLDQIFIGELGYRLEFLTRFYTGFITPGFHYSRYFSQVGEFKKLGLQLGWGIIFPLARNFRMSAEMRALSMEKLVLGFGANFSFSL